MGGAQSTVAGALNGVGGGPTVMDGAQGTVKGVRLHCHGRSPRHCRQSSGWCGWRPHCNGRSHHIMDRVAQGTVDGDQRGKKESSGSY